MALYCFHKRKKLFEDKVAVRQGLVGGFYQAFCIFFLFRALELLPGPIVIIILFTHTLMLLLFMAWRGDIKLDAFVMTTTLIALGGLSLVLDIWHTPSPESLWGLFYAFLGALATLSRLYIWGKQTRERHPVVVGAECYAFTSFFVLLALFYGMPHFPHTWAGIGFTLMGCITLTVGTFGLFYGISLLGSFRWSLFLKLEPVFTALFSAIFLHQILKISQYVGILVVVVTLAIFQIIEVRQQKKSGAL